MSPSCSLPNTRRQRQSKSRVVLYVYYIFLRVLWIEFSPTRNPSSTPRNVSSLPTTSFRVCAQTEMNGCMGSTLVNVVSYFDALESARVDKRFGPAHVQ